MRTRTTENFTFLVVSKKAPPNLTCGNLALRLTIGKSKQTSFTFHPSPVHSPLAISDLFFRINTLGNKPLNLLDFCLGGKDDNIFLFGGKKIVNSVVELSRNLYVYEG